jgi:hypothetical protein
MGPGFEAPVGTLTPELLLRLLESKKQVSILFTVTAVITFGVFFGFLFTFWNELEVLLVI